MLRDEFELIKNAVSKNSIVFKIFFKKNLELLPCYQIFGLEAMLVLMPLLNYYFLKK